jgi:dihydrofolate reductase
MTRLIVSEFLTLDGIMQAPGDPKEDRTGGFKHGGWQLAYFDELFGQAIQESLASASGLLLGRRTFEIFASHWPNQSAEDPLAGTLNALPKHVVSSTLTEPLSWQNSTLIKKDNVAEEITRLKGQSGKELLVMGSGELVRALIGQDLVDEYRLMIHPILLGSGKRLFPEGSAITRLKLVDSKTTSTGVLIVTYAPATAA